MRFFFADSVDTVDPSYDFILDRCSKERNRQYTDIYAHEVLGYPPYDGVLISRSLVGGFTGQGRYSQAQRYRLEREGIREFLRYPKKGYAGNPLEYPIMGDCGSFSYINREVPPFKVKEIVDFYETCKFTHGVSPDHIILEKNPKWDDGRTRPNSISARAEYTLASAVEFYNECQKKKVSFTPIGVSQGWSVRSTLEYAKKLVNTGYQYIGIGGFAARPTEEILNVVAEIRSTVPRAIQIHLFGFNRLDRIDEFQGIGLTSFDSASPMLKSFRDDKYNYFSASGKHYLAIRVPQIDQTEVKNAIRRNYLNYDDLAIIEQRCMEALHAYGDRKCELEGVLNCLRDYERLISPRRSFLELYFRTLVDRPWEKCRCQVCQNIGIDAVIYRGLNRNKRRGVHNLHVYYGKLNLVRNATTIRVPCLKIIQNKDKPIFAFAVNGKDVPKFAAVSRILRSGEDVMVGYQRNEILDHILEIKTYLEKKDSILPNSIVIAFNKRLSFTVEKDINEWCQMGMLEIPSDEDNKTGWIVDGQQRLAAIRNLVQDQYPISCIGFESANVDDERQQFVLVNNTRPLPKSLVYELLPAIKGAVPSRMIKRQKAYLMLEKLNYSEQSPFYMRIRTHTSEHLESANIKDVSVLRMIENSRDNGILGKYPGDLDRQFGILRNYWNAVRRMYADAWVLPPKRSRLTHGVGIISMGYIMDGVCHKIVSGGGIHNEKTIFEELKRLGSSIPWTNGIWEFSENTHVPWNEIQNTNRHIDIVTNYLLRKYRGQQA